MPLRPVVLLVCLVALPGLAGAAGRTIATDRVWQRLPPPAGHGGRKTLDAAAQALGERRIRLAGVTVVATDLAALAATPDDTPLERAVRERFGRPVDLGDFLLLLDDLAAADPAALANRPLYLPSGRARGAGILLHPDDVFGDHPRNYGGGRLGLDRPPRPTDLEPTADGDPLGARWTARFRNPLEEEPMLAALERRDHTGFADRIRALLRQFRRQGAEAYVFSTVRSRERGYLIYGAFILSRAQTANQVERRAAKLDRLNREWQLDIPILWRHPDGWRATIEAARAMANAYNVVYATQRGARYSSHYDGDAVDLAVMDLPRKVTLKAPDGSATRTFDLSAPDEARDLNLNPRLIDWIEAHFHLHKLRGDYPHWTDRAP